MKLIKNLFLTLTVLTMLISSLASCASDSTECNHLYANGVDWVITKYPTCDNEGSSYNECLRCGEKVVLPVQKLGHDFSTPEIIEPTCTEGGWMESNCSRCKLKVISDRTPALGHNYENGVCTACGEGENAD